MYAAIFIDAIVVKVRDGQVANRPIYAAIGVSLEGDKDILGLWAGTGGEGAKFWMAVLTDLKNRGVRDTFFVVCDGLKGLPEVVGNVWPQAIVQTCIIHLIRNTFRLASRRDWDALKRDLKPVYTAINAAAARAAFDELAERWGGRYPAIIRLWESAWEEFIPFLDYDVEIRQVICSTNAIESLNARYRRAVRARGHFPSEQAALKCLYLVTRSFGSDRNRQDPLDHALEARSQRIRHNLRRPIPGRRNPMSTAGNTVNEILPSSYWGGRFVLLGALAKIVARRRDPWRFESRQARGSAGSREGPEVGDAVADDGGEFAFVGSGGPSLHGQAKYSHAGFGGEVRLLLVEPLSRRAVVMAAA